jgi:GntR family transcriptional regulator
MNNLDPDNPEPLYRQLSSHLINQIKAGEHKPGDKLPSIRELSKMYQVSDITVRSAMEVLRQEEYVYSVQGQGYFLAQRVIRKLMPTTEGFSENVEKEGLTPSSIVLIAEIERAGSELGRQFGISPDSEIVVLERVRLGDGTPLCVQISHLPHSMCPGLLEYDFSRQSLYRVLREEYKIRMGKSRYTIQAGLAGERELHHLNLKDPSAVLWVRHWAYTPSGKLFEYGKTAYRSDRYQIKSNINEYELIPESSS